VSDRALIPFNSPRVVGHEYEYMRAAVAGRHLSGNGPFTKRCQHRLEQRLGARRVLLAHSCTAALEMSAILLDLRPDDEVIMPSFAFVSCANAVVLRGACPVFVDVRPDTLNIDERLIEPAVSPRTRAVLVVHYAGVACDMDGIGTVAERHGLAVIEDAAQGILASYRGRPLGSMGRLGAISFHETKNVISGEGGALIVNDPRFLERAEIVWEKGTNRSQFFRGQVDKYTWMDVGSSYLPSELTAAFLQAQLEYADELIGDRLAIWNKYHAAFEELEATGLLRRPIVPDGCKHNGHMYYILAPDGAARDAFLAALRADRIDAIFHYVPLHSSPAGGRFGRRHGALIHTDSAAERIIRLPIWSGMSEEQTDRVVASVRAAVAALQH